MLQSDLSAFVYFNTNKESQTSYYFGLAPLWQFSLTESLQILTAIPSFPMYSVNLPLDFLCFQFGQNQRKPSVYAASLTLSYYNALVNAAYNSSCFHILTSSVSKFYMASIYLRRAFMRKMDTGKFTNWGIC